MVDNYKSLMEYLTEFANSGAVPMHMPGHKRNDRGLDFLEKLGAKYDITEIEGFDNLHRPEGILKNCMARAAELWGSERCFYLVNGSTVGMLAGLRAAKRNTGKSEIIVARNCHKSVYNAIELLELNPTYVVPEIIKGFGFCGSIAEKTLELALQSSPGAPVVITSPTYEGVLSNISEIAVICHIYGSPLIVDCAHGAHMGLSNYFPDSAVEAGADIVIQSLHKTLTGLTQTALIHVSGCLIDPKTVARELSVFETSSPSYPLMASIDGTVRLMGQRGEELLSAWSRRLDSFDARIAGLQKIKIPGHSDFFPCQKVKRAGYVPHMLKVKNVYGYDRSKIVISCEGTDTTGVQLMRRLREEYNIYCEMATVGYAVAMTGIRDRDEDMERLAEALCDLDTKTETSRPRLPFHGTKLLPCRMPAFAAIGKPTRRLALRDAQGEISAEYVWAYPPGIPMVVPGEELTEDVINSFVIQKENSVSLQSTCEEMPKYIRVIRQ